MQGRAGVGSDLIPPEPNKEDPYKYVDPSLKAILECSVEYKDATKVGRLGELPLVVDETSLCLRWGAISPFCEEPMISLDHLVTLASQCEDAVFDSAHGGSDDDDWSIRPSVEEILPRRIAALLTLVVQADQTPEEREAQTLVATLLSFNMLEAAIRDACDKKAGRAPLLKTMIERIANDGTTLTGSDSVDAKARSTASRPEKSRSIASILRALLLPTGINLRNLLWHGFVPAIHRRWLALSAVLAISLEDMARQTSMPLHHSSSTSSVSDQDAVNKSLNCVRAMRQHDTTMKILEHGRQLLHSDEDLYLMERVAAASFVPATHRNLLHVALHKYARSSPVCFAAVMSILIEHSIRLLWCKENGRPEDIIAQRGYGRYYVTLDGHGQRDRHDILLMPYLASSGNDDDGPAGGSSFGEENRLVRRLGGATISFLSDLFTSPHGPNIRSAVTHGIWDGYLYQELEMRCTPAGTSASKEDLSDITFALLAGLHLAATASCIGQNEADDALLFPSNLLTVCRPTFSYTSAMSRNVDAVLAKLEQLNTLANFNKSAISSMESMGVEQRGALTSLSRREIPIPYLVSIKEHIFSIYNLDPASCWTADDVFGEHAYNVHLAECGAACTLLADVSVAVKGYTDSVQAALGSREDETGGASSHKRKQAIRLCSMASLTLQLYKVATFVALLYIEQEVTGEFTEQSAAQLPKEALRKAVERSRMVVSTYSTLLEINTGRATKSASDYAAGRAIKVVLNTNEDGS